MITKAIYPGIFDPLIYGHLDIIVRVSKIFDKIFLAVSDNLQKKLLFFLEERTFFSKRATEKLSNIAVFGFDELTVNVMKRKQK